MNEADVITLHHGTNGAYTQFPAQVAGVFEDGGVCMTTHRALSGCYGRNIITVAVPADALRVKSLTPSEWFLVSDQDIERLKLNGFDGLKIVGNRSFNNGEGFEPADATFFWDWFMIWNTQTLNLWIEDVQHDGGGAFEDLPEVAEAMVGRSLVGVR